MNLKSIFGNTGDGVCAIDRNGVIQYWNDAAETLLGYPAAKALGQPCRGIFRGRDCAGNRLCREQCGVRALAAESEPIRHFEMRTTSAHNRPVWLDVSVINVAASANDPGLLVHLFRDVTALHELESPGHTNGLLSNSSDDDDDAAPPLARHLTAREREVLAQVKVGASTAEIAEKLGIRPATVRNHIQNVFTKLDVHTRLKAVAYVNGHQP